MRVDAKLCHVDVEGRTVLCTPRGKLFEDLGERKHPLAVGDLVRVEVDGDQAGIEAVLPRRNYLGRIASSHDPREQVLFANVDRLLVVAAVRKPDFSSIRTDRILAACAWHDIPAALVLNKVDLARHGEAESIRASYEQAEIEVLETSATLGTGLEALRERLAGAVTALSGGSGVGKSTLLNALQPGLGLKVGKISRYWDAGKHTTSHSQLVALESGGFVIDTPGLRAFRLHGATSADLRGLFPEFSRFQAGCRFPDCSHDHEPQCAVFAAVDTGEIAPSRYASYVAMLDELRQGPAAGNVEAAPEESPEEGE